jgi:hypothetical protein
MSFPTRPGLIAPAALLIACSESDPAALPGNGSGNAPAVMVAVQARSPESNNLYVGVYPELPTEIDPAAMLEVPSGQDARTFNGHVYVWDGESGTYTRYAVDDALQLSEQGKVSFANLGGTGAVMTSFISPTRAYTMTRDNLQLVAWDPTEMALIGSISTDALLDPEYPDLDYGEPVVFGDHVAWPILWYDEDNFRFKPELGVVLASSTSLEPLSVQRDTRCGGGWSLFKDTAGDLYVTGNAWFGFAHFFGPDAASWPNDCVLRMRSGSTQFDPDYYVDLNRLADTPAVYHTWHTRGHGLVATVWDPADDPGALSDPDAYWSAPLLRKLVEIDDGVVTPLGGIPKSAVFSTLDYRLDEELYLLMSEGSPEQEESGRSSLYRVTASGAELALTTVGDIWAIGRVR